MEYRILEINVLSANDLKNANLFTKMDAYAVLTLSGDTRLSHQKFKTHVDREGGNNPSWNFPVKFRIDKAASEKNQLTLTFTIRCDRALGDKDVGTVVVLLKELYDDMAAADGGKLTSSTTTQMKSVTYQVGSLLGSRRASSTSPTSSARPRSTLTLGWREQPFPLLTPWGPAPGIRLRLPMFRPCISPRRHLLLHMHTPRSSIQGMYTEDIRHLHRSPVTDTHRLLRQGTVTLHHNSLKTGIIWGWDWGQDCSVEFSGDC